MIFKIKNSQLKTIINESFRGERGLINLGNDSVEKIALNNAKIMLSNKEPLLKIKQTTGWEIGYDGKWKYENIDGNIIQIPHSQIHVLSDIWDDDDLYKLYCRFLKRYQPKMFVFENVPGLLTANKGISRLYLMNMLI